MKKYYFLFFLILISCSEQVLIDGTYYINSCTEVHNTYERYWEESVQRRFYTIRETSSEFFLIVYNNGKQARLTNSFTCNGKPIGDFEYDVNELSENSVSLSLKYSPLPKDFSKWKKEYELALKNYNDSLQIRSDWKYTPENPIRPKHPEHPHNDNPYYEKLVDYCNKKDFKYFKEIDNGLEIINKTMIVRKEKGVLSFGQPYGCYFAIHIRE